MPRGSTTSRTWLQTAFPVVIALLFCWPTRGEARCGHQPPLLDDFFPNSGALLFHLQTNSSPAAPLSAKSFTFPKQGNWFTLFVMDLKEAYTGWFSWTGTLPCDRCPHGTRLPEKSCQGPHCSEHVPPTAPPMSSPSERTHESVFLSVPGKTSQTTSISRFWDAGVSLPPHSLLESIFHPPRSL